MPAKSPIGESIRARFNGESEGCSGPESPGAYAKFDTVPIVRVVVAVPFAVKVDAAGETLHVTYVGRLLQLRLSVSLKPFSLVSVTVVVWLLCVGTVRPVSYTHLQHQ